MTRYPIQQQKLAKQSYTPSIKNKDDQHDTIKINVNDTKIPPIPDDDVVEYMMGYITLEKGLILCEEKYEKSVTRELI